jgi:hypothetical protein
MVQGWLLGVEWHLALNVCASLVRSCFNFLAGDCIS